jgi:hypothetical protein
MSYTNNSSLVQKKLRQEIVLRMKDGTVLLGRIFLGFNERIVDVMNEVRNFIPIELDTKEIILIAKSEIGYIDLFQYAAENTSGFENKIQDSYFYNMQNKQIAYNPQYPQKQDTPKVPDEEHNKNYDEIYARYIDIIKILNNSKFQEKRNKDKDFDNNITQIIESLKMASYLMENPKK